MFQKQELDRLQERKALLVLQSEENRQKLADDLNRLSSADFWLGEAHETIRRHPAITAALAAAGGMLAVRFIRSPGGITGALGRFGKLASIATTLWRLFRKKEEEP